MYTLRELQLKDALRMLEWMHDEKIMQFFRFNGKEKTLDSVKLFIADSTKDTHNIHKAIVNDMDIYCGTVSLKNIEEETAEFAIVIHPDSLNKGAGSIAIRKMLFEGFFNLNLERIYLNVIKSNLHAKHVYQKYGFCYKYSSLEYFKGVEMLLDWYEVKKENFKKYCMESTNNK